MSLLAALTPRNLFRTALDMEVEGADLLATTASSGEDRLGWLEHANRLHVFRLFQYADHAVAACDVSGIASLTACTDHLDASDRVWVREGLGYNFARGRGDLRDLASCSPESLVPMHAGLGLAIACASLPRSDVDDAALAIDRAGADCRAASADGFELVAFEAVGLAIRTLAPQTIPLVDLALARRDQVRRACFWHGVGRGSYFAISNWRTAGATPAGAADWFRARATTTLAERNAIAGFAWAVTLVNAQTPEVLEHYVGALADHADADALRDGVESALIVWQHAAPHDPAAERIIAHRPGTSADADDWDRLAVRAAEAARARYPQLARAGALQDCFHCGHP